MKVIHLSHSDVDGGAARAAYRIHQALRVSGVESTLLVNAASIDDWTVQGPRTKLEKYCLKLRPLVGSLATKLSHTGNPALHSPSILPSGRVRALNASNADVLHLHWVQGEMLSIEDIGRLCKAVVWTLHDMWAFCGAEHYTEDSRWRDGYLADNRPGHERGFDLNRWTWERKRKCWRRPMYIVTPSRWLASCVRESALMQDWSVTVIPNCLDTKQWQPVDQTLARSLLGWPVDAPLLLFGSVGGGRDPRKGFDLLMQALIHLRRQMPELHLAVFGQLAPRNPPDLGFPVHYTGHLYDDLSLRILYSAADAMVIPSRQDNLPNTGIEAHACGTPVVAFDIGGLPDIVKHQRTGYLTKPFDILDLARGIEWVLSDPQRLAQLRMQARKEAVACFDSAVVAKQYREVYEAVIQLPKRCK